jgi:hypothetical protein
MRSKQEVVLKPGQVIRCTKVFDADRTTNCITNGDVMWARYSPGLDMEWIGRPPGLAVWHNHDEFEIFDEADIPDEYYVAVAKRALLGEDVNNENN